MHAFSIEQNTEQILGYQPCKAHWVTCITHWKFSVAQIDQMVCWILQFHHPLIVFGFPFSS